MNKAITIMLLLASFLFADIVKVNETIQNFNLPDQFGKNHTVNSKDYKLIIVSVQKDTSVMLNKFLEKQEKGFLKKKSAIFISDIHSMPSLITKFFALPKMKKYKYPLLLVYDEKENIFPKKENHLTVLKLQNDKVVSISYEKDVAKIF